MQTGFEISIPEELSEGESARILYTLLLRHSLLQLSLYLESGSSVLMEPFRAALHRVLNEGLVQPSSYLRSRDEAALLDLTAKLAADLSERVSAEQES